MRHSVKHFTKHLTLLLLLVIASTSVIFAQVGSGSPTVYLDIAHGQRFWNDPTDLVKGSGEDVERLKYMTSQLEATASSVGASLKFIKTEIKPETLNNDGLLFIHIPSAQYTKAETEAVRQFVEEGGSLFLVLDSDYWSTLAQTNVNDLIESFGIQFGGESKDTKPGGYAASSAVTPEKMKVIYHGARTVTGGTPFSFNDQSDEPFGTYTDVEGGGRVVVMGDGMVSLYMTSWEGVEYDQTQEFMQAVFQWLLD